MGGRAVDGIRLQITDLFAGGDLIVEILLYSTVLTILCLTSLGICFFTVFFVFMTLWPGYALLVRGERTGQALVRSWNGMKHHFFMGGVFSMVLALLAIGTALTAGIGLLVFIPMVIIISSLACRDVVLFDPSTVVGLPVQSPAQNESVWPPRPSSGGSAAGQGSPGQDVTP